MAAQCLLLRRLKLEVEVTKRRHSRQSALTYPDSTNLNCSPACSLNRSSRPRSARQAGLRRSRVMSVSSEGDPEGGEGRRGSRAWWRSVAAMLTAPARHSTPITRFRKTAMTPRWALFSDGL